MNKRLMTTLSVLLISLSISTTLSAFVSGTCNGHEYVDLGLPSGTLWATCNIGADSPKDFGDYFAWGETVAKQKYNTSTYKHFNNTIVDNKNCLMADYDAAKANWGGNWCTPTRTQWQELKSYTTQTVMIQNGVYGLLVTGINGNSIFLPAAGYYVKDGFSYDIYYTRTPDCGCYWSKSLNKDSSYAWSFEFYTSQQSIYARDRTEGRPVRAVLPPSKNGTLNGHDYVDLGLPSGTLWATCNLGANAPEDYGYYLAWGETTQKTTFDWSNYKYCKGGENDLTKYCANPDFGNNGFVDNLLFLQPGDDAATVIWGDGWCMPTPEQWVELDDYTTYSWINKNGKWGMLVTGTNGNTLFFPSPGDFQGDGPVSKDRVGFYWSSSPYVNKPGWAMNVYFKYDTIDNEPIFWISSRPYCVGLPIRAVCCASKQ